MSQVSSTPTHGVSFACGSGARGHRLHVAPQGGGTHAAAQQVQDVGQAPETDAVHVQVGHPCPEGLRMLAGGHVGWQGRGVAQTGLALPARDAQAAEHAPMAG